VFYFLKTPTFMRHLYARAIWQLPNDRKEIYLTFDDGPVEGITDKTLDILKHTGVRATFFCVGQNVTSNPALFQRIIDEGHHVGNHSFNHLNGWNTDNDAYYRNIAQAGELIPSSLFRPPYGKIKRVQLAQLSQYYKVIMWDVLSGDFDPKSSVDQVIDNVVKNTTSGSIIVLHDNEKCGQKMIASLPELLNLLLNKGFTFGVLPYH
jgi:peptidoglycan-N-acetylglucosamine deacetylase